MKGFVATPRDTVDSMIDLLFQGHPPSADDSVLDPGCGTGEFIDGVIRWCRRQRVSLPRITGIEADPRHEATLRAKYDRISAIRIEIADFLAGRDARFRFVVGNPPYVPITELSETEKARYRGRYSTARGRFDLYLLFFEEALRRLAPAGRLVFITPEKYLYVETAGPLRDMLARYHVETIRLVREDTFGERVTYPTITVVSRTAHGETHVMRRDGTTVNVKLPRTRDSWLPLLEGDAVTCGGVTLGDVCLRVSCGVATGADGVFVRQAQGLDPALRPYAYPTISGRELTPATRELGSRFVMLIPYGTDGRLIALDRLGALRRYLMRDDVRRRLLARTCAKRKPWHAFHETPSLREILRPKILCKDIGETPRFWVDRSGEIVPRHSVYYIVPHNPDAVEVLVQYLRSASAHAWLRRNCQRASQGFLRLQSRVLQRLPLPQDVFQAANAECVRPGGRAARQTELSFG